MKVNSNEVSNVAALISDPSRSAMMSLLMDGRHHAAGELAAAAGISAQTASYHLVKMTETGVVRVERHGRHRYFSIARQESAEVMEQILSLSKPAPVTSLRQSTQMQILRHARFCYDHLAGQLAVAITEALVNGGYVVKEGMQYEVTSTGEAFFGDFGLDLSELRKRRRSFSRCCLDWTERRHHLAGSLGQALTQQMFVRGWLKRHEAGRGVDVTVDGRTGIGGLFGIEVSGV